MLFGKIILPRGSATDPSIQFLGRDREAGIYVSGQGIVNINGGRTAEVRINSRTHSKASGDTIGFQSKIRQGAATTGSVFGCQIEPSVSDTMTVGGAVIGVHIAPYLRGTGAGTITGDVRGMQIELVTDDAGTRDIGGYVTGLRMRMAFSAGTVTGLISAFRIEKAETQTNSEQWGYLFDLTGDNALVWRDDYTTEVSAAGAVAGAIKVRVNGADRWIALYDTAPTV